MNPRVSLLTLITVLFFSNTLASTGYGDELRPAYLQITQTSAESFTVVWKVPARGANQRLAAF